MARPRVWLEARIYPEALERLEAVADCVISKDVNEVPNCDAIVIGSVIPINAEFIQQAGPRLKVVARPGIGIDNIVVSDCEDAGVLVIHTPDAPTESTAEHTVGLMLSLAKNITLADRRIRGLDIPFQQLQGMELLGRTLGVIGLGRIGRRVAEICANGIRMNVIGYDPFVQADALSHIKMNLVDNLDAIFEQSDIVTIHVPVLADTRHIVNEKRLRQMKKGAVLINAGRGALVDEAALYEALQDGHLSGAALDVFEVEPPEPTNPLFQLNNVVVTPHISSYTDAGLSGMGHGVVDQLIDIFEGRMPVSLVNRSTWPGRLNI